MKPNCIETRKSCENVQPYAASMKIGSRQAHCLVFLLIALAHTFTSSSDGMGSLYCINGITETGLVLNESRDFEFYHGMHGSQLIVTNIIGLSFFLTRRITDTMQFTHTHTRIHDDRTHVGPASRVTLGLSYFRNNPNRESPGINGVRRVITGLGLVFSGMGWGCDPSDDNIEMLFRVWVVPERPEARVLSDIYGRPTSMGGGLIMQCTASGGLTAWCGRSNVCGPRLILREHIILVGMSFVDAAFFQYRLHGGARTAACPCPIKHPCQTADWPAISYVPSYPGAVN